MPGEILDWSDISLVVFDMDGTLYDQRPLRWRMLAVLLHETVRTASLDTLLTLREFRRSREVLATKSCGNFLDAQYAVPAARRGCPPEHVRSLVTEWIEKRPLAYLSQCRRPGVDRVFAALRIAGKRIGILSDYPAREKLAALGLDADFVVSSTDEDVGRPKPDPAGLFKLMRLAEVDPRQTLLIGDREDRDWEVARRSNVPARILGHRFHAEVDCFDSFSDPLFDPLLRAPAACGA